MTYFLLPWLQHCLPYYLYLQVWVVSSAAPRLPLLIEDASRPDTDDVSVITETH